MLGLLIWYAKLSLPFPPVQGEIGGGETGQGRGLAVATEAARRGGGGGGRGGGTIYHMRSHTYILYICIHSHSGTQDRGLKVESTGEAPKDTGTQPSQFLW